MPRDFPEVFAILRDGVRNPCLQILRAFPCEYNRSMRSHHTQRGYYEVSNVANLNDYYGRLIRAPSAIQQDRRIYAFHYYHPVSGEPQEVYYWFTPFILESSERMIVPLLEFQYRSWIPTGYQPVPIHANININEMYEVLSVIQEERLAEIRHVEDRDSIHTLSPRHHDMPYFHPHVYNDDYDMHPWGIGATHRNTRMRHPSPPPPPPSRIVESVVRVVEVPVERVVVQHKVLPLPKDVGSILLSHARKSADSCPIAAIPFAECEKLCVSSCFHIFDAASLARWQETHTSCPVCRSKIENTVVEQREASDGVSAV